MFKELIYAMTYRLQKELIDEICEIAERLEDAAVDAQDIQNASLIGLTHTYILMAQRDEELERKRKECAFDEMCANEL